MNKTNYRPKDAASFLGVGLSTFFLYVSQGKIKTIKLSDRVTIVRQEELDRFIQSARSTS